MRGWINRRFTKFTIFRNKNLHTLACFFISDSFVSRFQANIVLGRLLFLTLQKNSRHFTCGMWDSGVDVLVSSFKMASQFDCPPLISNGSKN